MSQLKESRGLALGAMMIAVLSLGASVVTLACGADRDDSAAAGLRTAAGAPAATATPTPAIREPASEAKTTASRSTATHVTAGLAKEPKDEKPAVLSAVAPTNALPVKAAVATTGLVVKRFVVTRAVRAREPVSGEAPLVADGNAVYAFAELVNRDSTEQKISVTFERKGSTHSVGHATLTVPANVPRHRTWANTRFIREPGTWEAVLWTETGTELSRTSFEVTAP